MTDDGLADVQPNKMEHLSVHGREIWNAAVDAAGKIASDACQFITAGEIRKLKK